MRASEMREMSNENLQILLKEAKDALFRLRIQSRMERLDSPSELRKNKKVIARALTMMRERSVNK